MIMVDRQHARVPLSTMNKTLNPHLVWELPGACKHCKEYLSKCLKWSSSIIM